MLEQTLECLVDTADATRPLHAVRPSGLAAFLDSLPPGAGAGSCVSSISPRRPRS